MDGSAVPCHNFLYHSQSDAASPSRVASGFIGSVKCLKNALQTFFRHTRPIILKYYSDLCAAVLPVQPDSYLGLGIDTVADGIGKQIVKTRFICAPSNSMG